MAKSSSMSTSSSNAIGTGFSRAEDGVIGKFGAAGRVGAVGNDDGMIKELVRRRGCSISTLISFLNSKVTCPFKKACQFGPIV